MKKMTYTTALLFVLMASSNVRAEENWALKPLPPLKPGQVFFYGESPVETLYSYNELHLIHDTLACGIKEQRCVEKVIAENQGPGLDPITEEMMAGFEEYCHAIYTDCMNEIPFLPGY